MFTFFAQVEAWQLYPETLETLERLKRQELIVGVISNFDSRLFELLDGFGMSHFFDTIVISTQAGAAKPEGKIFTHALGQRSLSPAQAMHVGDSYEMDIEGARVAGLTPVLIDRETESSQTHDCLSVRNLLELPTLL